MLTSDTQSGIFPTEIIWQYATGKWCIFEVSPEIGPIEGTHYINCRSELAEYVEFWNLSIQNGNISFSLKYLIYFPSDSTYHLEKVKNTENKWPSTMPCRNFITSLVIFEILSDIVNCMCWQRNQPYYHVCSSGKIKYAKGVLGSK